MTAQPAQKWRRCKIDLSFYNTWGYNISKLNWTLMFGIPLLEGQNDQLSLITFSRTLSQSCTIPARTYEAQVELNCCLKSWGLEVTPLAHPFVQKILIHSKNQILALFDKAAKLGKVSKDTNKTFWLKLTLTVWTGLPKVLLPTLKTLLWNRNKDRPLLDKKSRFEHRGDGVFASWKFALKRHVASEFAGVTKVNGNL